MDSSTLIAFPGQRICAADENTISGSGTYERLGYIYASLAGIVETKIENKVNKQNINHMCTLKNDISNV
jgi:exosome complex component CSL4